MSHTLTAAAALTTLSEEEQLFRQTVREFAETEIKPHVSEMDEVGQFRADLVEKFFGLGLIYESQHQKDKLAKHLQEYVKTWREKGGIDRPSRSPLIKPLALTDHERRDLVAFLETLTGTPEEKNKAMETFAKAQAEKIAVEIMGDKGRDFVAKMIKEFH